MGRSSSHRTLMFARASGDLFKGYATVRVGELRLGQEEARTAGKSWLEVVREKACCISVNVVSAIQELSEDNGDSHRQAQVHQVGAVKFMNVLRSDHVS
jgi:hypothetical protein